MAAKLTAKVSDSFNISEWLAIVSRSDGPLPIIMSRSCFRDPALEGLRDSSMAFPSDAMASMISFVFPILNVASMDNRGSGG